MRNFLFAAAMARQEGAPFFGVIVICPDCTGENIREQVAPFRTTILQPQFAERIQFATYETYIELLQNYGADAAELGRFLDQRIREVAAPK